MKITAPDYVQNVLNVLFEHGFTACLVGGCVRDMFLNVIPNDWDIATAATPDEILSIFPDSLTIGIKHGTVTVKQGKKLVEVTTFRLDGNYLDHRHPECVQFVSDIKEDLSRRDFTINAIAVTHDGTVIDPYFGLNDLKNHIIRAVGIPEMRFEEDALRMFRAFRFSSRLDYKIENETLSSIKKCSHLAGSLSSERIRDELDKIIISNFPHYFSDIIHLGLLDKYINKREPFTPDYSIISKADTRLSKWTLVCYYLLSDCIIDSVETFLTSLRMDKNTVYVCSKSCEIISHDAPVERTDYKRLLSKYGTDIVNNICVCFDSIYDSKHHLQLTDIINSGECFSIKDLAINGNDLKLMGINGKDIGNTLSMVLDFVITDPGLNRHNVLINLVKEKSRICYISEQ